MNSDWIEFDFHGLATLKVANDAPTASQLRDMFAPFLSSDLGAPDIVVTGDTVPVPTLSKGDEEYEYSDDSLYIRATGVQILRRDGAFHINGTRELLTAVLPILDLVMIDRQAAMIHAATVRLGNTGICMPAWGGVGKTSTVAKLMKREGASFLGDDWAFLTSDGNILGFHKPMFIKPHHRPIYPHLFANTHKPLIPSRLSHRVARLTTIVHPFVTRFPRVAGVSRRWSPEHMMVQPHDAFPAVPMGTRAPLDVMVFVERSYGSHPNLIEKDRSWMVDRVLGNFHAELSLSSRELLTAMAATGMISPSTLFARKASIVRDAIGDLRTHLLQEIGRAHV